MRYFSKPVVQNRFRSSLHKYMFIIIAILEKVGKKKEVKFLTQVR